MHKGANIAEAISYNSTNWESFSKGVRSQGRQEQEVIIPLNGKHRGAAIAWAIWIRNNDSSLLVGEAQEVRLFSKRNQTRMPSFFLRHQVGAKSRRVQFDLAPLWKYEHVPRTLNGLNSKYNEFV